MQECQAFPARLAISATFCHWQLVAVIVSYCHFSDYFGGFYIFYCHMGILDLLNSSGTTPLQSACNTTLYYNSICQVLPAIHRIVGKEGVSVGCMFPGLHCAIQLLLLNSMRISELLALKAGDEVKPSMFLVKGAKRSRSYTIHIPIDFRNRRQLTAMEKNTRLFPFAYKRVYDTMVRFNLAVTIPGHKNRAVTHQGRFQLAANLIEKRECIYCGDLLHHKSKTAQDFYLNPGIQQKRPGSH